MSKSRTISCAKFLATALLVAAFSHAAAFADELPIPENFIAVTAPPIPNLDLDPKAADYSREQHGSVFQYLVSLMLLPLFLTILIEAPIIAIAGRGSKESWRAAVLTNALTNPIAVIAFLLSQSLLPGASASIRLACIGIIEIEVVLVEWRIFEKALGWPSRKARIVSAIANLASFGASVILLQVIKVN
jgi:hypothetical protein